MMEGQGVKMKKIKIGLLGAGFVSQLHLDAYKKVSGIPVEVAGIVNRSNAAKLAQEHDITRIYDTYEQMLEDKDIDVIDICTPNIHHAEQCVQAARAKKHIICEKPLTGAFGEGYQGDPLKTGYASKLDMYKEAMNNAEAIIQAAEENNVKICYAEDFVYAPAVLKAKRLLKQSRGVIFEMRSEESHSGSHAEYARQWNLAGGGSLLRLGSHPVGLILHMKQYEGLLREGKPIGVKSVLADIDSLTQTKAFKGVKDKWVVDAWKDVEDWATVILTFEDGTKSIIHSNDTTLGGVVNTLDIYASNSVIKCNMASNDSVMAYAPRNDVFGDEYISEKIQTKAGWTYPSPDEDWMRGYPQEMQDFVEAIAYDREPVSNGELGRQVVQVIYAAYLSMEQDKHINIQDL